MSSNYFQTRKHLKGYILNWWHLTVNPLGSLCDEGTVYVLTMFTLPPEMASPVSFPGIPSPSLLEVNRTKGSKCRTPLSLLPYSQRCIWHFFFWQQLCWFLKMYIHQLPSGHHWAWLLGFNYLIISQTPWAHLHWAPLSIDRWLIAPKVSCLKGMILIHQVGQHWSTGSGCKGTTDVALN